MTQSDPTRTPQGSGGVATGPGSETGNGSSNGSAGSTDRSAPSGDPTRRSAPTARSDQAPRRQRIIPPLRTSESTPATESQAPAKEAAKKTAPASAQPTSSRAPQKSAPKKAPASSSSPKAAAKTGRPAPARTSAAASASRRPRRARLRLTQIDAWTVMKTAFLLSIALGIVSVVAVAIVWTVLGAAGVFDSLNSTVQTLLGNDFRVQDYIGTGRVLGFTMLLAVVDVVLLTAIATLGAFLYNLSATLLGGVELTLTEDG